MANGTAATLDAPAKVERAGAKILLTTDKPLYQPGQTVHLRALGLDRQTGKPMAAGTALFEIQDGRGNKVMKRSLKSDGYGISATAFRIGPVVNMGPWKARVVVGPDTTEKTFEVSRYALPKFKVGVAADRPFYMPGHG